MRRNIWLMGAAAGFLSAGLLITAPKVTGAATLPAGITVGGIELGGMTKEDADKKIAEYVNGMSGQQITLTVGDNEISTTAAELGFLWTNQEEVEAAAENYSGGDLLERYLDVRSLQKKPVDLPVTAEVEEGKVSAFVTEQCAPFVTAGKDAEITRENGQFVITDSVDGMEVDLEATKAALDEALKGGLTEPVKVEAVIKESRPVKTADMLMTITDVLGTFSTGFNTGNTSRSTNLRNGASKVNGSVIMPGEEFSAYECLNPFTQANGYASAASYENGKVVDSVGGGACQLSTTLYNAALWAEVEISQRQNHSMIVTYVKPSQDAAIAGTYKDLKFKNNYSTPIYIEGDVTGGKLTFTIYGKETRPAGRTIKFVSETLGTIDPGEPTTRLDNSMPPGSRVKEQSAHVGRRSRLWKYVYVDGAETEKEILHTDAYMASKATYRVGPEAAAAPPETVPMPEQPAQPPQPEAPQGPASDGPAADTGGAPPEPAGPAGPGA